MNDRTGTIGPAVAGGPHPPGGRSLHKRYRGAADPFVVDLGYELRFREPHRAPEIHVRPVDWTAAFGAARPLRVELGIGKSEFLIRMALAHPDYNYVGFEYESRRVESFIRKVRALGATNVRAVCCDLTGILDRLFAPASIDRFFVLFPDPWPKRRHAKHRFVQSSAVSRLVPLLASGGGVTLRTDAGAYASQMLEVLEARSELENLAGQGRFAAAPRDPFPTLYERKFAAQGRRIYYLEFRKRCGWS
jgi:tRNA (guanine-N7-)-methyltransferase